MGKKMQKNRASERLMDLANKVPSSLSVRKEELERLARAGNGQKDRDFYSDLPEAITRLKNWVRNPEKYSSHPPVLTKKEKADLEVLVTQMYALSNEGMEN